LIWQPELYYLPVGFGLAFLIALFTREKILDMIARAEFVRPNFKGEEIPLAAGVIFFISAVSATLPLFFFWPPGLKDTALLYLLAMAGATLLGLMDDFWGSREASGLMGHFKALVKGRLTTGAVKALGGGILALILAAQLYPGAIWRILDSSLIIALSINLINLFDLRPGRAGKIFIILYVILLPAALGGPEAVPATMVLGALLAFLPADLKARAMMGDAGSNTLGIVIGLTAAIALEGYYRSGYLGALILMHIVTERYSLTRIIAGNFVLNFLDMLGREQDTRK
jgi:UDP-N-acetylmuramyl pentapeptide phosphotransferase/UDP-N-acetylglucosamine-1-phosphate transferase